MKKPYEQYYESIIKKIDFCKKNNIKHMNTNDDVYISEALIECCEGDYDGDSSCIKCILDIFNRTIGEGITPSMPILNYIKKASTQTVDAIDANLSMNNPSNASEGIKPWTGTSGAYKRIKFYEQYFPNHDIELINDILQFAFSIEHEKTKDMELIIKNLIPKFIKLSTIDNQRNSKNEKRAIKDFIMRVLELDSNYEPSPD